MFRADDRLSLVKLFLTLHQLLIKLIRYSRQVWDGLQRILKQCLNEQTEEYKSHRSSIINKKKRIEKL